MSTGIILFAHGARDPEWARPLHRLQRMLAERMPNALIEPAFLEYAAPPLEDAAADLIARGATELSIVPVFIANGGHLREDQPRRVAALGLLHPGVPLRIAPPIGEVDTILVAITGWIEGMHTP
ncbi:MAG: cobalamin biosynthesis protein CbiX [Betaproteobacteria bacterium]|nr:cobalamin biosynthesis protein CbiX [Betaproteobacteria bacterium]